MTSSQTVVPAKPARLPSTSTMRPTSRTSDLGCTTTPLTSAIHRGPHHARRRHTPTARPDTATTEGQTVPAVALDAALPRRGLPVGQVHAHGTTPHPFAPCHLVSAGVSCQRRPRRRGRVVEGTPLLRVQAGNRLEGSNPFVSATIRPFASSDHRRLAAGAARSSTNPTASILGSRWTPNDTSRANLHTGAHRSLRIQQEGEGRTALTMIRTLKEQCIHRQRFDSVQHATLAIGD